MSLAVPSTWYFQRTARAAKLKFPSSEGARTPGPVYRIAFCPRYHRGFRPSPTLTESTDSFLAGCAVCCLRMWDQDHIWGRRLPPEVSGLQHFHKIVSPATFRPTECLIGHASYLPRAVGHLGSGGRNVDDLWQVSGTRQTRWHRSTWNAT